MQDIRKVLCWIFAFNALVYVLFSLRSMYAISRPYAALAPRDLLITVLFQVVEASVTGVAWWAILSRKSSARAWGIAASIMYVLSFLRPIVFSLRCVWWRDLGALFIGVVGLIAFLWHDKGDPRELP
jgi:hypothetical protein